MKRPSRKQDSISMTADIGSGLYLWAVRTTPRFCEIWIRRQGMYHAVWFATVPACRMDRAKLLEMMQEPEQQKQMDDLICRNFLCGCEHLTWKDGKCVISYDH